MSGRLISHYTRCVAVLLMDVVIGSMSLSLLCNYSITTLSHRPYIHVSKATGSYHKEISLGPRGVHCHLGLDEDGTESGSFFVR